MKIKKLITAFCLAAGLALSAPVLSGTLGADPALATVSAAEGWNQEGAGRYYEKDGERVTGPMRIGKKTYYFRTSNGMLQTGRSGLVKSSTEKNTYFCFSSAKDGSLITNKWVKHKGKYFYADATGRVKLGTIKVNGKLYHITRTGRLTSYKKSPIDKKYYYASKNGVLRTGLQTIGKRKYYFNTKTGERQSGTITVGKYTYHFNTQSGYARTGWVKLKNVYYYYNQKCQRLTGFQTINGKRYYLNPKKNGARVTSSWCKIGAHYYYFDSKGVLKTGFITVNGKRYYTSSSGVRKKGWQTVNGRKYYMDQKTAVVKTGWFTYKNKKYYLNPTKNSPTYGAAKTGWVKISNSWYYFNTDGTMKTGWLLDNMKYFYLDPKTGKMLTGRQVIDGKTYNFGTSGGFTAQLTGEWVIRVNRKQCCITIYRGNTPVKAMICSTAKDGTSTPTGTFRLQDKLRWHELIGPSWGQYCSHITSDILFHSVTYSRPGDNRSLFTSAYNNLGKPASAGCIRLRVIDAKWMYDNLPVGTKVIISDHESMPLGKPSIVPIPASQNYDPTDPNI